MNLEAVEKVARAVLYEGYMLYPYTAGSVKNQQRWNFGALHPAAYDTSEMRAECLVRELSGDRSQPPLITARVRFLQGDAERSIQLSIPLPGSESNQMAETLVSARSEPVPAQPGLYRLTLVIRNTSAAEPATRDEAIAHTMLSTHALLTVQGAEFLSLIDPPTEFQYAASQCRNTGCFPVLAGNPGERDTMLALPIILYDYPEVAPESPGDLFDATEIDEILTLRVLTLSDAEKAEIRNGDGRAREILERCETLPPEHLMKLHGVLRGLDGRDRQMSQPGIRRGDRVRLHPRRGADILDIALRGKLGTVEAVEEDFEGRVHLAVVLDDDPGRDLGMMRQPGHRFFFALEEVELVP